MIGFLLNNKQKLYNQIITELVQLFLMRNFLAPQSYINEIKYNICLMKLTVSFVRKFHVQRRQPVFVVSTFQFIIMEVAIKYHLNVLV